jgi:hypothetical protein
VTPRRRNDYLEDLDEIQSRARKAIKIYIGNGRQKWDAEKVERRDPRDYRRASSIPAKCQNPYCREYLPRGSREEGRCLACNTELP